MNEEDVKIIIDAINKKKYESDETSLSPKALEIKEVITMQDWKNAFGEKHGIIPKERKE